MSNNILNPLLNEINNLKNFNENEFEKQTPRKMTIHILSDKEKDCKSLAEFLTKEKFPYSRELLCKNIKNKVNLYSYMNYIVYTNASDMMKKMIRKCELAQKEKEKEIFSEVIMIIDNENIYTQIKEIREIINDDDNIILQNEYYIPFILIISPRELYLKDFLKTKTFKYEIYPKDLFTLNDDTNKEIKDEIIKFYRKINVIFSYYNELGDEFSFTNSEGKNISIELEYSDFPINMNILLLGESGAGKSTLLNLILGEKKSLEGGNGVSTTTKNIIVFKKDNVPIKFYDVRGIEDNKSLDNYVNILTELNGNIKKSNDSLNAILYCMKYETGTVIKKSISKIFEKLIDFNVPILFIITHTPYDIRKKSKNKKAEKERKIEREIIRTTINEFIKSALLNKNKEKEIEIFINEFVKIYYVNSVINYSKEIPAFGIDELLSFFQKLVPEENWKELEESCLKKDAEKCKEYCRNNFFLKNYSQFDLIKERNRKIALNYLYQLRAGAFFSGFVPGLDIGMEYLYRHLFKEKLKFLYGFDCDQV